ncbi:class I SAM-dependent methyltransferase [Mameliella alba]|uniref:Williams-Beuren syndrome chromosome region 27 n=1 Tax=Mameliella alba TaxID=561184 RepID=A0A0B3RG15_9RHOB|nr:class I SAM-dependent methyltransferase [Mameliella alba]KHQ50170.1 Williams-Beuren syndrome chromosome region 27 [Mameliella alba]
MMADMSPTTAVPDPLRSPGAYAPLALQGDTLVDESGTSVGRRVGPVWSFMEKPDEFYEGKYNNRMRYVPRGDGWLATLPLRIVMQSYPTTVAAEVPKGATVVEIGCAGGLTWFGQRYRMIGMDLSQEALQLAAEDYELTLQCDATRMPLADASVDAVISSCLFEHLTDEQKTALLAEAFRVLKPGGKVVFLYDLWTENAVIAGYRRADPDRYQRDFLDHDGHLGYRSVDQNRAFFRNAGLRITREIFHERTPFQSNSVWKKFSGWPGMRGRVGRIGAALTGGPLRLPMLAALSLTDATLGQLFPQPHARGMITVAVKP